MSIGVTLAVLCAALFHAIWNSLIKGGKDPLLASMMLCSVWLVICLFLMVSLPLPNIESWPYAAAAVIIHNGYFFLLSKSYQMGDFGAVYPIVRGLPPVLVAIGGYLLIDESLTTYGSLGVVLITFGIIILAITNKHGSGHSLKLVIFAVATALMIAAYTLVDSLGARISGHSTSFFAWFSFFQAITFITIVVFLRGKKACIDYLVSHWKYGVVGGILSFSGYAIVLWAVTKAPIAYISALRESSVLFASIISVVFLKESLQISRMISVLLIFGGICAIKWA